MNVTTDKGVILQRFQENILARKGLVSCGDGFTVALHTCGRPLYAGTNRLGQASDTSARELISLCAKGGSVLALRENGTVYSIGRSGAEVSFLEGIASARLVDGTEHYVVVLLANGKLLVGGDAPHASREIAEWPTVLDVACGKDFIAGLTADGRVILAGGSRMMRYIVSTWTGVAGIFSDLQGKALYALTAEGKLLGTRSIPLRARDWRNLTFVASSGRRLCAVTAAGQLLSTRKLPTDMASKSFVTCSVGEQHTVAVTRDGEVLAFGDDSFGQCRTAGMGRVFDQFEEFVAYRRDCSVRMEQSAQIYQQRRAEVASFAGRMSCGKRLTACVTVRGHALASAGVLGNKSWSDVCQISCGNAHILALTDDGCVLAEGNAVGNNGRDCCFVQDWQNVRFVTAGAYHSLGVTHDGRVYFCGDNQHGQGDVEEWSSIRLVRTTDTYTVGLTYEGHLLIAGLPPFDPLLLEPFNGQIEDVVATSTHILCRLSDGRAVATLPPDPGTGRTDLDPVVSSWCHVADVAAGEGISVALCYGGSVRVSGGDAAMREEIVSWRETVSVSCGGTYVVGLGMDGRLHIAGAPMLARKCHTDGARAHVMADAPVQTPYAESANWQDILAVACGPSHLIALNRDGQILACGSDSDGQCSSTAHFTLFRDAHSQETYGKSRRAEKTVKNL